MQRTLHIASADEMRALGAALGRVAEPGDRLLLEGELGAGKTTFVQGLAIGLGVTGQVSSPSFVIEHQYTGRLVLYHIDLYRLDRVEPELVESLDEHLFSGGVSAVEWAERLPPEFKEGATRLRIEPDGSGRRVTLCTSAERFLAAL